MAPHKLCNKMMLNEMTLFKDLLYLKLFLFPSWEAWVYFLGPFRLSASQYLIFNVYP